MAICEATGEFSMEFDPHDFNVGIACEFVIVEAATLFVGGAEELDLFVPGAEATGFEGEANAS